MPLLQFIGSLIAVAIVALIAARMFPNKSKLTRERVIHNTARYCPHIDLGSAAPTIFISELGDTAVLIFPNYDDGISLATTLGDRVVIREIKDTGQLRIKETDSSLLIDLHDFTQPTLKLVLQSDDRNALLAVLQNQSPDQPEPAHA